MDCTGEEDQVYEILNWIGRHKLKLHNKKKYCFQTFIQGHLSDPYSRGQVRSGCVSVFVWVKGLVLEVI